MLVRTVSEALALIEGKAELPSNGKIELGREFALRIKIPHPPVNASITPAFMEAFMEFQRQLYQLSALQKKGVANASYLSESDKRELDISVAVKEGSSILNCGAWGGFEAFFGQYGGKNVKRTNNYSRPFPRNPLKHGLGL